MYSTDGHSTYPIQPDISRNTSDYREKVVLWNPVTKNPAVLFQFNIEKDQRSNFLIIPDGCMELLFKCNETSPQILLFGKRTLLHYLKLEAGNTYFGYRPFYEAGLRLRGLSNPDLIDQIVELHDFPEAEALLISLINAKSFKQRCNIFAKTGIKAFWASDRSNDFLIECSRRICLSHGTLDIDSLGRTLGYTNRHIRKRYKDFFGIPPVTFKQLIRFQNSIRLLSNAEGCERLDFAQLSQTSGYYDQSYMIRDYKKYVQMTPKGLHESVFTKR